MFPGTASLDLAGALDGKRLTLVCATDGLRRCRSSGLEAIPTNRACSLVDALGRSDISAVRSFLARSRLGRLDLSQVKDSEVLTLLRQYVKCGALVVLRELDGDRAGQGSATRELRRLVSDIEAKVHGRLVLSGRQYRLVADVDLETLPDRNSYEVTSHDEAAGVLDAMVAQKAGEGPGLAKLLLEGRDRLSRDWRPPLRPDGLVLLRRIVRTEVAESDGPSLTPSQVKKLLRKPEWIEIVVEDQDGEPYPGRYRIRLPDGTSAEGTLDEEAFYGNYDLDAGQCALELLDRTEPKQTPGGDDERSLPVTLGDDIHLPDDATFVLAGGGETISIPLADKFDAVVGAYDFVLEPLRSGIMYTGTLTYGETSKTMFEDDDLYTRAGGPVDQPLDFNLDEPDHLLESGNPDALQADPPMREQTVADEQQSAQVPDSETCDLVPGEFGTHWETGADN